MMVISIPDYYGCSENLELSLVDFILFQKEWEKEILPGYDEIDIHEQVDQMIYDCYRFYTFGDSWDVMKHRWDFGK